MHYGLKFNIPENFKVDHEWIDPVRRSVNLALKLSDRPVERYCRDIIFALALSRPPHLNDARPLPR